MKKLLLYISLFIISLSAVVANQPNSNINILEPEVLESFRIYGLDIALTSKNHKLNFSHPQINKYIIEAYWQGNKDGHKLVHSMEVLLLPLAEMILDAKMRIDAFEQKYAHLLNQDSEFQSDEKFAYLNEKLDLL
ncbi:MAG: hypothetical protein C5B43_04780 [Verrucomicrobia bacterium]|nr:MAG: hypothetical protein C5B43_04780 [Verrucomicrobiota bacterium]